MFHLTTHSTHFHLRLYGVGHMVKDHSDNPIHGIIYTTAFVTQAVEHWLQREIFQWANSLIIANYELFISNN